MRVFKTKPFARFTKREAISDAQLSDAMLEIENGLIDGDLGGGLIKKRVARSGRGKRGGYRTAVAYREGRRAVFLYGFPKNDKGNLTDLEVEEYRKLAKIYLRLSDAAIAEEVEKQSLTEVDYVKKKI